MPQYSWSALLDETHVAYWSCGTMGNMFSWELKSLILCTQGVTVENQAFQSLGIPPQLSHLPKNIPEMLASSVWIGRESQTFSQMSFRVHLSKRKKNWADSPRPWGAQFCTGIPKLHTIRPIKPPSLCPRQLESMDRSRMTTFSHYEANRLPPQ